jgi:hypothetical protein
MIEANRQQRKALEAENKRWPEILKSIPSSEWPRMESYTITKVWRSRRFLVQQYENPGEPIRLSINTVTLEANGRWKDGITWDDIQAIKRQCGYAERYAVELYPADVDVVNVANVRHIWLLDEPPSYAWRYDGV